MKIMLWYCEFPLHKWAVFNNSKILRWSSNQRQVYSIYVCKYIVHT